MTIVPTASSIKMRFPEFIDVADAVVEFAIEDARGDIGDGSNWTANSTLAMAYLAAHYVSAAVTAAGGGTSSGNIASESIGRLSITYAQSGLTTAANATPDDKTSTSYGRRYLELVGANFSGACVI